MSKSNTLPSWPEFDEEMIRATEAVLRSGRVNYWTGEECRLFEREFAQWVGTAHAVSVANGTVALELALEAGRIGRGDEVIVPSRTFVATASAVVARHATPVVADVDLVSQNITAATIKPLLTPRTKAIIVVHLAGWPCDMEPIMELAEQHGLLVIEDCAQAHGASIGGRRVGSIGHIGAFSFCQDKIMTTGGEGGMLTTNDEQIWERAWSYKDHGKSREALQPPSGRTVFRWVTERFGTNWRMTEMQAAIGRIALKRVAEWIQARRANAAQFDAAFESLPGLVVSRPPANVAHSYYKYYVRLDPAIVGDRDEIVFQLQSQGVPCGSGSCSEIYREKAFRDARLGPVGRLPTARLLGETSLMLPVHPTLRPADVEQIAARVCRAIASRSQQTLSSAA